MEGTIKTLKESFGFITVEGEEGGKDLFFHFKEMSGEESKKEELFRALQIGDRVSFEKADSPKGPNAVNVMKI